MACDQLPQGWKRWEDILRTQGARTQDQHGELGPASAGRGRVCVGSGWRCWLAVLSCRIAFPGNQLCSFRMSLPHLCMSAQEAGMINGCDWPVLWNNWARGTTPALAPLQQGVWGALMQSKQDGDYDQDAF